MMSESPVTPSATSDPVALVIEDDDKLSLLYAEALRQAHFKPVVVLDGADAVAQITARVPALIILDLHLPHVSGSQILQQIRQDGTLATIHLIIITADAVQAEAMQDEADLILVKPISILQLRDLARRIRSTLT
jgi:two-component system cell cycle response regulator DivK